MRLFEVEDSFLTDLTMQLRNMLGDPSKTGDEEIVLPYEAISNMLKNMGYGEINYKVFDKIASGDSPLAPGNGLVANYDENGVTLATANADANAEPPLNPNPSSKGKGVDQMAHHAVQDIL